MHRQEAVRTTLLQEQNNSLASKATGPSQYDIKNGSESAYFVELLLRIQAETPLHEIGNDRAQTSSSLSMVQRSVMAPLQRSHKRGSLFFTTPDFSFFTSVYQKVPTD